MRCMEVDVPAEQGVAFALRKPHIQGPCFFLVIVDVDQRYALGFFYCASGLWNALFCRASASARQQGRH